MNKQWDEQTILDNIRAGKQTGATYVFNQYGKRLLPFFERQFKLSHEEAEDALQETFIAFIKSVREDKFRREASLFTYLSKIGVNECLRIIKENSKPEGVLIDGVPIEEVPNPTDLIEALHNRLCVAKVLEEFEKNEENAAERLTALTFQFEDRSIKEIADEIGRKEGATKTFIFECKKKLRPYLRKCRNERN